MTRKECDFILATVTPKEVFAGMGYGDTPPDERVARTVAWVLEEAKEVAKPRFCYQVFKAEWDSFLPILRVGETCLEMGDVIARQLGGSEAFAFFVATAGVEYDEWCRRQDDELRAYVADTIGSVLVERCADQMEETLQTAIDKLGWRHTNRFSPGYCGWHVWDQHLLFALLGEAPCGVTLTEGAMMLPVKSVSGVVGIGTDVRRLPYICTLCNMEHCFKRKKGKG